jgi:adenylosuccinate lyase
MRLSIAEILDEKIKERLARRHIQELINRLHEYDVEDLQEAVAIASAVEMLNEGLTAQVTDYEDFIKKADSIYNTCGNYLTKVLPTITSPIKLRSK